MIVDTSALIAVLRSEPDPGRYIDVLSRRRVADLSRQVCRDRLHDLPAQAGTKLLPVTIRHAQIARRAYRDFGKGSGHPAGLNVGDCFAYALARASGEPLLFKGDDFSQTDIRSALS